MRPTDTCFSTAIVLTLAALGLSGCGIDRGGITVTNQLTPSLASVSKVYYGPVDAVTADTISVNGTTLTITAATGTRDGNVVAASTLALGDLIWAGVVETTTGPPGISTFELNHIVVGPVTNVDSTAGTLAVMGVPIATSGATELPTPLAALVVGDVYAVSGTRDATGVVRATRVSPADAGATFVLTGTLAEVEVGTLLQTGVVLPGSPPNGLPGLYRATGSVLSGAFLATSAIELLGAFPLPDFAASLADTSVTYVVQGSVETGPQPNEFLLGGVRVIVDAATEFVGGSDLDLVGDALVVVEGQLATDLTVTASRIDFQTPGVSAASGHVDGPSGPILSAYLGIAANAVPTVVYSVPFSGFSGSRI